MYARVTLFEIDTVRYDLGAAVERFTDLVLPELREQPGYEGVYVVAGPEGKGLVMSLWQSELDAEAALRGGFYTAQLEKFITIFRSSPGREGYDVVLVDAPALAQSEAPS
jgi:heme-degrading monooxygenase HmoA